MRRDDTKAHSFHDRMGECIGGERAGLPEVASLSAGALRRGKSQPTPHCQAAEPKFDRKVNAKLGQSNQTERKH